MLRWLIAILVIALGVAGYMGWRTNEFMQHMEPTVPAAQARPVPIDIAAASARLSQAIKFQTVTAPDGAPRDPQEFENFTNWIIATYPSLSSAALIERIGDHSLLFTWKGADETAAPVLLVAHLDVAAPEASARPQWRVEPFSGEIKDGAVWGRGAQLGKGPLIAMLEASELLARSGFKPRRTILLAFGQDGDARGERGAAQIARVLAARKVKAWFALDEGTPIIQSYPLTAKPAALIGVTEKRELDLIVTAVGAGGPASVRGPEAITTVSQALLAIDAMPNPVALGEEPTRSMLAVLARDMPQQRVFVLANSWLLEPLVIMQMRNTPGAEDLLSTTVQPTVVAAGDAQSQRPSAAHATVNVRLHPRESADDFISRARAVISPFQGVNVEWARPPGPKPPVSSHQSEAYRLVAGLAARASDGATVAPSLYVGSTDARHYTGVAQDVYRFTPAIWTSDDIRTVMNANEKLSQANLARMIQFYHQLLAESAK